MNQIVKEQRRAFMRKVLISLAGIIFITAFLLVIYVAKEHVYQPGVPTIGHLYLSEVDRKTFNGFKDAMETYGYREGETVEYVTGRSMGDITQLRSAADELVAMNVDLVFVSSTPATSAIREATLKKKIPVVFCPVNDPVASGIVAEISQPGDNITGIRLAIGDEKRFQLLKEIDPAVKKVFFPYTQYDKSALRSLQQIEQVATQLGVTIIRAPTAGKDTITDVINTIPQDIDAIFLPRDTLMESYIDTFVEISLERKISISAPSSLQVDSGALFSYGHNHYQLGVQAARLASQVLKGGNPGSLPVETAKYYFDINLKSARLIGLDISDELLRRADRIIR